MSASFQLSIDLISDLVCPWCYIGHLRLKQALKQIPQFQVTLRLQPFELNPDMPEEGQNLGEHMIEKYGRTLEQSGDSRQLLKAIGLTLGIEFSSSPQARIVNTLRAHQLLAWAETQNKEHELILALFAAYFSDDRDLNSVAVLKNIASKVGLDSHEAGIILEKEQYRLPVRKREAHWLQRGVQSVPTFIFNEQFAISGAREPGELQAVIEDLAATGKLASATTPS